MNLCHGLRLKGSTEGSLQSELLITKELGINTAARGVAVLLDALDSVTMVLLVYIDENENLQRGLIHTLIVVGMVLRFGHFDDSRDGWIKTKTWA